jgi:hypothetical protein
MPLERDEGEYAYPAQLLLDGVPPYREAYGMKMPGILGAYALVLATFGETRAGIHLGLLVVNAASAWLVLLLGRRLLDPVAGATAAIVLLLLTLHPGVHGLAANTEHFVILPALAGLWLVVRGGDTRRLASIAVGGACLGLAFLTKQTALFWVLFGALVALADDRRRRPRGAPVGLVAFAAGAAVPVVATGLALLAAGVFESFWYWTVRYPLHYAAAAPLHQVALELRGALPSVVGATLPCWLLAGIGLVIALARRRALGRPGFLPGWLLCAGLSVAVGMRFRPQHFLLLTPVLALLAGLAVSRIGEQVVRRGPRALAGVVQVALVAVAVASFAWGERRILFTAPPMEAARLVYGTNPFPESIEVARFLREHTAPDETIAVLGSEPQIYFYAKRRSASPGRAGALHAARDDPGAGPCQAPVPRLREREGLLATAGRFAGGDFRLVPEPDPRRLPAGGLGPHPSRREDRGPLGGAGRWAASDRRHRDRGLEAPGRRPVGPAATVAGG